MSVAVSHWMMTEVEVIVYPTLHWYVYVNIAQETDKACIQQQISRCRKGEQYPKCNASTC